MTLITVETQTQYIDTLPEHPSLETQKPSVGATNSDPLIAKGGEKIVYMGCFLLVIGLVAIVGVVSRRIEYAILLALVLSVILIAFFLL